MSRFPQVALQPTARPVDAFYRPDIAKPEPPALLAELAHALSEVAPQLQPIVDRRGAAYVEGSQMRAKADAAVRRFSNMTALKEAVDAGQIDERDNPWYMVQLKQEVARHEAEQAAAAARVAYYNDESGIKFQDDPAAVERFLNERFASVVQGRDVWEMEALAPALEHAGKQIVSEHIRNRQEQREQERGISFQNTVSSFLNKIDKETLDEAWEGHDSPALTRVQQVQSALQNLIDRSRMTVHGPKLDRWLIEAAVNTGIMREDERFYRNILSQIKDSSGNSLNDSHEAKAIMEQADERIHEIKRRRVREEAEDERLAEEKEQKAALGAFQKIIDANPGVDIMDLKVPFSAMSPTVRRNLELIQQQTAQQQRSNKAYASQELTNYILKELVQGVSTNTIPPDRELELTVALAAEGEIGSVGYIASLKDRQRNDNWGPTSKETEISLYERLRAGTLSPKDVIQEMSDGNLDKADAHRWMQQALAVQSGQGRGALADENYVNTLGQLIFAKFSDSDGREVSDIRNDPALHERMVASRVAYEKQTSEWLRNNPSATPLERDKAFTEMMNTVAKNYGGYQYDEWQEKVQRKVEAPVVSTPTKQQNGKPVDPVIDSIRSVDPILGQLSNEDVLELQRVRQGASGGYTPNLAPTVTFPVQMNFDKLRFEFNAYEYRQQYDPIGLVIHLKDKVKTEAEQGFLERDFQNALLRKKMLRSVITNQNVVNRLKTELTATRKKVELTPEDQKRVILLDNLLREYAVISTHAGYSVDEVQAIGRGAWLRLPMFINVHDLAKRGQSVATELGLKSEQEIGSFVAAQRTLLSPTQEPPK